VDRLLTPRWSRCLHSSTLLLNPHTLIPLIWLQIVYKIDTTLSGASSVVAAYAAKPSISAGNPVAFTVLSNGDAFVSQQPSGLTARPMSH
jgi:hypothetical protein